MSKKTPNSKPLPVKVVGSSIFGRYNKISSEKTYNMFMSDGFLVNFAGYERLLQLLPAGEGRGIFTSVRGNFILVVVNSAVYTLNNVLAPTFIGNLATNAGPVFIDENLQNQICIVDGVSYYIYNHTLPPLIVAGAPVAGFVPNYVTFHNSFFLFGNSAVGGNGAQWFAYVFATPTTLALATTHALQTKPDTALAVVRIPGQSANVLVMGNSVCEIHTQIGGALNYRRVNTINVDYGCLSVDTIDNSDNYVAWLGINETNGPVLMVYSGQGAQPISTDGIDYLFSQLHFPAQSTAAFFRVDGHLFYQLSFVNPADNLTIAYDFDTKMFFNLSDQDLNHHPARDYAYFNQTTYMLNINNASIYETSTNITTYNENIAPANDPTQNHEIQRIRITDNMAQDDSDRFIANYLAITIEQGNDPNVTGFSYAEPVPIITEGIFAPANYPILTEQGFNITLESVFSHGDPYVIPYIPFVDLSVSLDGGVTWSANVRRLLNPVGHRKNILSWNKLGSMNYLTFKFRFWGLDRFVVNNGIVEISK